jgi:phage terminase small subunit
MLTQKQIAFCVHYFESGNGTEAAKLAGYKPKTAYASAWENLRKPEIQAYLAELRQKTESEAVANVLERKRVLTEIVRARCGDYTDEYGNLTVEGQDKLRTAAVQELRTERTKNGGLRTTLKLRDPVVAVQELNRMDGVYAITDTQQAQAPQIVQVVVNLNKGHTDEQVVEIENT